MLVYKTLYLYYIKLNYNKQHNIFYITKILYTLYQIMSTYVYNSLFQTYYRHIVHTVNKQFLTYSSTSGPITIE